MVESRKGRIVTEETRNKIRLKSIGRKHTPETIKKMSEAKKGPKNPWFRIGFMNGRKRELSPQWKGGKSKNSNGYILIRKPEHPRCLNNGYVYEHVLNMEKKLERPIVDEEQVHHINGIRDDNDIDNLHLFPNNSEHVKYHYMLRQIVIEELEINQSGEQ